jgi:NADPH2:quinone reductase
MTPSTLSAVQIGRNGGVEVLEYKTDLPVPELEPGQLLVENAFIGINYIDNYVRSGLYPTPSFPITLGKEGSGTVLALASSGNFFGIKVGDRVTYNVGNGAYASHSVVNADKTIVVPEHISLEDAAAAPLQAMTAYTLLTDSHTVQKDDWILVTAAAGGVGQWLVQMGKSIGAKVIATCSTSKIDLVKKLGADLVIDYSKEDYVKPVLDATDGKGVIAVFDSVGKSTFDDSLNCVARKGTMVSFGNSSGAVPPFAISRLAQKNVKVLRPTLFNYIATRDEMETVAKAVWEFMQKPGVKVDIYKIYPLKDAAEALTDIESRKTTGKLLLKP